MLFILHQGTEVSLIIIHKILELDLCSLKVVLHKEVMNFLHVLSVVGPTRGCVIMSTPVSQVWLEQYIHDRMH